MRNKILLMLLFLIFRIGLTETKAQNLIIRLNTGSETTQPVNSVRSLTFPDGELLLAFRSDTSDSYSLSEISKLYFGTPSAVSEYAQTSDRLLNVCPNPVGNELTVSHIPEGTSIIYIYRSDGELVLKKLISSEEEIINVSRLSSGLYLLIADKQVIKFIKL